MSHWKTSAIRRSIVVWVLLLALIPALVACGRQSGDEELPTLAALAAGTPDIAQIDLSAYPARLLDFGTPVTSTLDSTAALDVWLFAGKAGDGISLRTSGTPITLTLLGEDGSPVAQGETIDATLPSAGRYTVVAQLAGGTGGSYQLSLIHNQAMAISATSTPLPQVVGVPTPTPQSGSGTFVGSITAGSVIAGILTEDAPEHIYSYEGQAGQLVTIQMGRISDAVDPVLTLYGPDGAPIATDDNTGGNNGALLRLIRLPEDGLYSIHASGKGNVGNYTLSVTVNTEADLATPTRVATATPLPTLSSATATLQPAVSGNRLEDHVPVIGSIDRPGDVSRYPFFAAQGETVSVGVSPYVTSSVRPAIEVYGPDGDLVANAASSTSNAGGAAIISGLTVPTEGSYVIFVTGENGSAGPFVISYGTGTTREDVNRGEAPQNQPNNGRIDIPGLRDVWSVYLNRSDIVTAAVSPVDGSLDPLLEITTADGEPVAVDDNSGGGVNPQITQAVIPASGLYHLRVSDAHGTGSGGYVLVWRYINRAPTETPIPDAIPILSVAAIAQEGQYYFYPFQGHAGQSVRIRAVAVPGTGFDPVEALLSPNGQVLQQVDDSDGTLNPVMIITLPQDGTYTVRVNGYLTGGPYYLYVEVLY